MKWAKYYICIKTYTKFYSDRYNICMKNTIKKINKTKPNLPNNENINLCQHSIHPKHQICVHTIYCFLVKQYLKYLHISAVLKLQLNICGGLIKQCY